MRTILSTNYVDVKHPDGESCVCALQRRSPTNQCALWTATTCHKASLCGRCTPTYTPTVAMITESAIVIKVQAAVPLLTPRSPCVRWFAVTVTVKERVVTVKGPRGTLTKSFKHASLEIQMMNGGKKMRVDVW